MLTNQVTPELLKKLSFRVKKLDTFKKIINLLLIYKQSDMQIHNTYGSYCNQLEGQHQECCLRLKSGLDFEVLLNYVW